MGFQEIPRPLTRDFFLAVAAGKVDNAQVFKIPAYKSSISSTVWDDISGIPAVTTMPIPTDENAAGIRMEIVSSAATDLGGVTPGAGLRIVAIHYLDGNYDMKEEYVSLNGTTPVDTVATDIKRVLWIHSSTVGVTGYPDGNISLRNTAGTITYEYMPAGENQSMSSHFTVPAGKVGYIFGWEASSIKKEMAIRLRATVERADRTLKPGIFMFQDSRIMMNTSSGWTKYSVPLRFPALTDIKISAKGDAATGSAGGCFEIMIIDEGVELR